MRKTMTTVAGLAAAMMMMFASAALAQAPVDDVQDPYFEPTEEPTDGGGVDPVEVTAPPREEPEPSRQERPEAQELAETGMTASVGLVAGVGLLAAGGGLVAVSRRRKSALQ